MKKRLTIVAIIASMVLAFGCGKAEDAAQPETVEQAAEAENLEELQGYQIEKSFKLCEECQQCLEDIEFEAE